MQTPLALYIASLLGAVALVLLMPKQRVNWGKLGALLAAVSLGGVWLFLASLPQTLNFPGPTDPYYYLFSALALGSAVRVITHTRPVYAALWLWSCFPPPGFFSRWRRSSWPSR
jgi:hypothetical protein